MSLGFKGKFNKKCDIVQVNISKIDLVYLINQNSESNENVKMDNLKKRRKRLVIFLIIIILSLFSIILFGTLCSDDVCALSSISISRKKFSEHHINRHNNLNNISNNGSFNNKYSHSHLLSYDDVLNDDFQNKFDINSNDVMVILCNIRYYFILVFVAVCDLTSFKHMKYLFLFFFQVFLHIQKVKLFISHISLARMVMNS